MGKFTETLDYQIHSINKGFRTSFFYITSAGIVYKDKRYDTNTKNPERNLFEYIVSGKGHIECEGKRYTVNAGDCAVIRANHEVRYYSDPSDPYIKLWFTAVGNFADTVCRMFAGDAPVTVVAKDVYSAFEKLLGNLENDGADSLRDAHSFLDIMHAVFVSESQKEPKYLSLTDRIKSYVETFYQEDISVHDVAEHFGISERYLIEQFKKEFDTTPYQYIKKRRLSAAQQLVIKSEYTISEISGILNFCEPGYFTKEFKKEFGVSPAEMRKNKDKYLAGSVAAVPARQDAQRRAERFGLGTEPTDVP